MFSTAVRSKSARVILGVVLAGVITASAHAASIFFAPGALALLFGSSVAVEPDLAGVVLYDAVIPFTIKNGSGFTLYQASLQNRVVRSTSTGRLHFYFRIRDAAGSGHSMVAAIRTRGFSGQLCWVEYRTDGLGDVELDSAERSAGPGAFIYFYMPWYGPFGTQTTKFMFVKTNASNFGPGGLTTISLVTGEFVNVPTVRPLP